MFWKVYVVMFFFAIVAASFVSTAGASPSLAIPTMTITQDGTVIENQIINTNIVVEADDVIIRRCIITTNQMYGIKNHGWVGNDPISKNLLVENCIISGTTSAAIYGQYITIKGCTIFDCGVDGMKLARYAVVKNNHVHHLGKNDGSHADCIQIVGGEHFIIEDNWLDLPIADTLGNEYKSNACIIAQSDYSAVDVISIRNNYMEGGNYTVYLRDRGFGSPTNVRMHGNTFGTDYRFGPLSLDNSPTTSIDNNKWADGSFMDINYWDGDNK